MRIQFTKKDPRNGMTVDIPAYRARQLIATGAATEVAGNAAGRQPEPSDEQKAVVTAAKKAVTKPAAKKAK